MSVKWNEKTQAMQVESNGPSSSHHYLVNERVIWADNDRRTPEQLNLRPATVYGHEDGKVLIQTDDGGKFLVRADMLFKQVSDGTNRPALIHQVD